MAGKPSPNGPNGGRDAAGRFAPGNPGGPGNPFARRVASLRSRLLDAMTDSDLGEVVAGLLRAAKAGDVAAARLVLAYTVGQAAPAVNPDRLDIDEVRALNELIDALGDFRFNTVLDRNLVRMALDHVSDNAVEGLASDGGEGSDDGHGLPGPSEKSLS